MTRELIPTPEESKEYDFVLLNGLKEENDKLKKAITEVLEVLNGTGSPNLIWIKNHLTDSLK